MTGRPGEGTLAIDPVGTAGALAGAMGFASLAWPFFDGATAALAALAFVGWALRGFSVRPGSRFDRFRPTVAIVLAGTVAAWGFFLVDLAGGAYLRGTVLGASAALLGWVGRARPPFGEGS